LYRPTRLRLSAAITGACLSFVAGCSSSGGKSSGTSDLAWALISGVDDLYAQQVGGKPVGAQDQTADCPFGGTSHVTGTTDVPSDGSQHVDLSYELTDCRIGPINSTGELHADLTLSGTLSTKGFFADPTVELVYASDELAMHGTTSHGGSEVQVAESCEVHINRQSSTVNAILCGENVSW